MVLSFEETSMALYFFSVFPGFQNSKNLQIVVTEAKNFQIFL